MHTVCFDRHNPFIGYGCGQRRTVLVYSLAEERIRGSGGRTSHTKGFSAAVAAAASSSPRCTVGTQCPAIHRPPPTRTARTTPCSASDTALQSDDDDDDDDDDNVNDGIAAVARLAQSQVLPRAVCPSFSSSSTRTRARRPLKPLSPPPPPPLPPPSSSSSSPSCAPAVAASTRPLGPTATICASVTHTLPHCASPSPSSRRTSSGSRCSVVRTAATPSYGTDIVVVVVVVVVVPSYHLHYSTARSRTPGAKPELVLVLVGS